MIQRKALRTNVSTHKHMCRCVSVCTFIYLYICMCLYTCLPLPTTTAAEGSAGAYFKTKQIACWHFHFQNVSVNCFVKSNIISISLNHYSSKQCFPFKNALLFTTNFCWCINFTVPKVVILQSMLITWLDLICRAWTSCRKWGLSYNAVLSSPSPKTRTQITQKLPIHVNEKIMITLKYV